MVRAPSYRPDLPDYGLYAHWPEPGVSWIHPLDIGLVQSLVPSRRIFQRIRFDDTYYHLCYGKIRVRVRPTMWTLAPAVDVAVGDRVELLSQFGHNEPGIVTIKEILARPSGTEAEFVVRRGSMLLPRRFIRNQFRPLVTRFQLRSSPYSHQPPKFVPPTDIDMLDVGDIFDQ